MTNNKLIAPALALGLSCAAIAPAAAAEIPSHQLGNGVIEARVTDRIGGRLLAFGLAGKPNMLLVDQAAGAGARKPLDARSGHVPYNGHEIWVGPQSTWWTDQDVNRQRAKSKENWPPDPFLTLSNYTVSEKSAHSIALDGPASPVSGLKLSKRYALQPDQPNSMQLEVSATNVRERAVARDIWFNTRTYSDTRVYVPVAARADVRIMKVRGTTGAPLSFTLDDGIFSLNALKPPRGKRSRQGKILLQPSAGWMAGFHGEQAFIIRFALQPATAIHPEQGQIELYNDYQPSDLKKGLLEMELHAPFVTLAPGQTMRAAEQWTILPYAGAPTRAAHIAFLREQAERLGFALR